ncbi:MAG TPA: hypothetical protein VK582_08130 [Pyrinomonadaceae bacterium]|nr:hypothetical protein [Pyrinomonadaceae bacterium]
MPRINWPRLIIGGVIATLIVFVTDGVFHENVVSADWKAIHDNLGIPEVKHSGLGVLYFTVFELGRGLVGMFLYVIMRPQFRPGPKTAALAGVVAWIAFSVTGPAQFIPLGFFSNALWIKVAAFQLVTSILAGVAGAAVYRDGNATQ